MTLYIPAWVRPGVQSKVPVPFALSMNTAPLGRADVVKDGVLSMSVAETPKFRLTPSFVDCAPIAASTGNWLPPSLTVIVTISESTAELSSVA